MSCDFGRNDRTYLYKRPHNVRQADYYFANPRNKPYCISCKKIGHTVNRCFFRKYETHHDFRNSDCIYSPQLETQSLRYYNRQNPQQIRGQYETNKYHSRRNRSRWCVVHQSSGHNTNKCSIILQKRDEFQRNRYNQSRGRQEKLVRKSKVVTSPLGTTKASLIAALQKKDILSVPWIIGKCKLTLAVDTGACANILSKQAVDELIRVMPYTHWKIYPPDVQLSSVTGDILNIIGGITLTLKISKCTKPVIADFYIVENFPLPSDGLLGLETMSQYNIGIHPASKSITLGDIDYFALSSSRPFLRPNVAIDDSSKLLGSQSGVLSGVAKESLIACETPPGRHSDISDGRGTNWTLVSGVLSGGQRFHSQTLARVQVRLPDALEGTDVVCLSETVRVKGLSLESTLSSVREGGLTDVLVLNRTGSPFNLKSGCHLVDFLAYNTSVNVITRDITVASLNITNERVDKETLIAPHVKVNDIPQERDRLIDLLNEFSGVLTLPGEPLGKTDLIEHHISLEPGTNPVYVPAYRLPHSQKLAVEKEVKEMLDNNVIQHSSSPWNSPIFFVPKKDGGFRPVIDFRKVNDVTVPDRYPMPLLRDVLQSLGKGNAVFSNLDLQSGYWQIPLDTESRKVTAFSTNQGHFEFLRMPFGLRNAPLTFQRLINTIFAGIIGNTVLAYLDDLIIVSKDVDSHFQKLRKVLGTLKKAGLKLNLSKCEFLKSKVKFLGHIVDAEGIHTIPDKIKAIQGFPVPKTIENVRSFLGITGFYRSFIKGYSSIASPLTKLLKKDVNFDWGHQQEKSFNDLKIALTNAPILAFPDYNLPFTMCTDASAQGLGAVLMQKQNDGRFHTIAYASRKLNSAETRYSATHLETLAIVWALKHFRDIIFGYEIIIYTDHMPIKYIFTGKNLTGRLARWHLTIQEFEPKFEYLPGRANVVADALSRNIPVNNINKVSDFSHETVKEEQRKDPLWSQVIYALESGDESNIPHLPVPLNNFILNEDILFKCVRLNKKVVFQLVVPISLKESVLSLIHDVPHAGHPGRDRSIREARTKYYWKTMRKDIENYVLNCEVCAKHKGTTGKTAPILEYPIPNKPWDTVAIDILQLPRSHQGSLYVLVAVDHFSRFVVLAPLKTKSAIEVAHAFITNIICQFTTPKVLLSDNGSEFRNQIIEEICRQYGIKQTFVAAYHPASNGLVERANRKILEVLRPIVSSMQENWQDWLPYVAASINSSINSSTGKSPYYILYGYDKVLPYDILCQKTNPVYNSDDYAKTQMSVFQNIHKEVRNQLSASRAEMIYKQNKESELPSIDVGDVVMIKSPERSSKLSPKFYGPFQVLKKEYGNKYQIWNNIAKASEIVHVDRLKKVSKDILSQMQNDSQNTSANEKSNVIQNELQTSSEKDQLNKMQYELPNNLLNEQNKKANINDYKSKLRSASRN